VKITTERLPESRVLLEIEVDPERLEKAMNQAYRRVVTRARIPGFRPGKAPRAMVERYLGRETLLQEALDRLVPEVYDEAVKSEGIDPIDQPELEMPQLDPVIVKATIPVRPSVELGDYRAVRIEPEAVTVDEHLVDDSVEQLRHRYATVEPVERPVETGDLVRVDLRTMADGEVYFDHKDAEFAVTHEDTANLSGLAEGLVGVGKGESKEFSVDVPEDATGTTLAGKHLVYTVQVHEIKVENLPELNDEFAGMVGEGFPTVEALRSKLYADAQQRLENEAKRRDEQKALDQLVEGTTFEYPTVLVEREIDRMIREQTNLGDQKQAMQRYLAQIGKTEEEYRDQFRADATERVRRSLALSRFTEVEDLSVGDEDVTAEIEQMAADSGASSDQIREVFGGDSGRDVIQRSLLTRKAYERLLDITQGRPVPDLPEREEPAEAAAVTEAAETPTDEAAPAEAEPDAEAPEAGGERQDPKVPVPTTPETT
jgi:trigger factor